MAFSLTAIVAACVSALSAGWEEPPHAAVASQPCLANEVGEPGAPVVADFEEWRR